MQAMQQAFRALVGLLLAVFAAHASAAITVWRAGGVPNKTFPTAQLACAAANDQQYGAGQYTPTTITYTGTTPNRTASCNAKLTNGQDAGSYATEEECTGSQCEPPPVCKSGPGKLVNITIGYHSTPGTALARNQVVKYDPAFAAAQKNGGAASFCYEGCKVGADLRPDDSNSWISQVPGSNGLYRSSMDVRVQSTSQQCADSPPSMVQSSTSPPGCTGTLGTVNGSKVCLPTPGPSGGTDTAGTGEAKRGNPVAGEVNESASDGQRAPGPGNGGSSNGGGPTGGPATGANNSELKKGCNDGTKAPQPACSGSGTLDADGTITTPASGKQQANCGAPGQPKCAIDETGTPKPPGEDEWAAKLDTVKETAETQLGTMKGTEDKGMFEGWKTLFAAPPMVACSNVTLPHDISIDPCPVVDGVRYIMGLLWAAGGLFLCIGMVRRTL